MIAIPINAWNNDWWYSNTVQSVHTVNFSTTAVRHHGQENTNCTTRTYYEVRIIEYVASIRYTKNVGTSE